MNTPDAIQQQLVEHWFSLPELADLALPGLPSTRQGLQKLAERDGWLCRPRAGSGGGLEYAITNLIGPARAALEKRMAAERAQPDTRSAAKAQLSHEDAWAWFERLPDHKKIEARRRLEALSGVDRLVSTGTPKKQAMMLVAAQRDIGLSTLHSWEALVRGLPREHRLPRLAPRHAGATGPRTECHPEALDWLRSAWLSPSQPTVDACIRDLRAQAGLRGWTLPSDRTLRRHIESIDKVTASFWRHGPEATDRLFPMLRRDRSALHALEAVNCDGHKLDIMAAWPDGSTGRPVIWVFQDIYSGKWLSWRLDRTENTDTFRLAFGDMVERFGIPDHVYVDNTLAAANKTMSGGIARRFRFKVREEEALGILPALGVEVHFTRPYSGQSKPIERSFGDIARDVARHPAFEGAYLGSNPTAKPHNAGTRAVPIAELLAVLEQRIAEHNARPGRTAPACRGRSFDDTFAESYAAAPIRKATAEQRRIFLLAAESVTVRQDSTIHLLGNRYHDEQLVALIGSPVVVRFDPDRLHAPVHVYRLDGGFVCTAACWADVGFADTEAARRIAQAKKLRRRGVKLMAEAAKVIDAEQLARDIAAQAKEAAAAPETRVVRPIFRSAGNAALKPVSEPAESDPAEARDARQRRVLDALRAHHGPPQFRVVEDD
jgi:transposase InsO family protein